jgi:hypothetical protein
MAWFAPRSADIYSEGVAIRVWEVWRVQLFDLANEVGLTSEQAATVCARLGIDAASGADLVSDADAARFRDATRPAGAPVDAAAESPGWAAAPPAGGVNPYPAPPPGPFAPPAAAPFSAAPPPGFATPPPGYPAPPPAYAAPPAGYTAPGPAAAGMSVDDRARLESARRAANSAIWQGVMWVVGGIAITIAFIAFAPGGFVVITFGPVFVGIRRIMAGRTMMARVRQAERQLGLRR